MARALKRLSARSVATLTEPGRYSDGDGLKLVIDASGARRWFYFFNWEGKRKEMGLGGVSTVSLAEARDKAQAARKLALSGVNPIQARKAPSGPEKAITFGEFADALVEDIKDGFRNEKHRWQWSHTLKVYAAPLRALPVDSVTTEHILAVVKPLWQSKQETASRLRGRIERVLDAAKAKGHRAGENPARWRGHLDLLLPRRQKLQRGHHPAMPYDQVPAFVAELRDRDATAAAALEFTILCASRTGEVLGAVWSEFDLKTKIWTIPPQRMKAGLEHRVPLTGRAVQIVKAMAETKISDFVFPGQVKDKPLSNMAMMMLLRDRMKRPGLTVHGFRSSFRDWDGECTPFAREIAEAALAHVVGDQTERAYRRGNALAKRRELMDAWEGFVGAPNNDSKVVPLKSAKAR